MALRSTRREFLGLTGAGALIALTGCAGTSRDSASRSAWVQPTELVSRDGLLTVTLRAEAQQVSYGSGSRAAYTYNGTSPGPTLRLRPGDRLVLTLDNRLPAATNLHTHGLHVSPEGSADNIFVSVPPGTSRTYTYDIPRDHRSGTFWYHPHVHEHVAEQAAAGLAGAIVIDDHIDSLPSIASSTERVMVLSDPPLGNKAILPISMMAQMTGREGSRPLVNGVENPALDSAAGTLERWRFVNASASRYYRLALDGHTLHQIASDGGRFAAPRALDTLVVAPGERAEVLVAPERAGRYSLRSLVYDRGGMGGMGGMAGAASGSEAAVVLATLAVTGTADAAALPSALADPPTFSSLVPAQTRALQLVMGGGSGTAMGGMGGGMMGFTIDGKTFDPNRTDQRVALGSTEEWIIENLTPMAHPFHLHVWPFYVEGGPPGPKDTVDVPANASVRVRIPFSGIAGRSVYHCHILDHEDLGMMGTIVVA